MIDQPLIRIGMRFSRAYPLQTLLLVIGISLGVAVVIAIDMANASVGRSFTFSTEGLTGRATHRIIGHRGNIDQAIYTRLRVELGFRKCAPVVTGYAMVPEMDGRWMRILGVDPFTETDFRNYFNGNQGTNQTETFTTVIMQRQHIVLGRHLAEEYQLSSGNSLTLDVGGEKNKMTIAGLLDANSRFAEKALNGLILMDIATAQELLGWGDRISYIDLIIGNDSPTVLDRIQPILTTGVEIESTRKRSTDIRQLSAAFESNLTAFSLLALIVGGFLIYNTVTFSVVRRRNLIGILRAIGATRGQIFKMIVFETLVLGFIGIFLGFVLGYLLGIGAVRMVTETVSQMYYPLAVSDYSISMPTLAKGFFLGVLVSLISAIFPALEAARVAPADALRRSVLESRLNRIIPVLILSGTIFTGTGTGLLFLPGKGLIPGFTGIFLIVVGSAFWMPCLCNWMSKIIARIMDATGNISGKMAVRNIPKSLSRTSVSIAALMISVAVFIGVGLMVDSLRTSVMVWIDHTMRADIYITGTDEMNPGVPDWVKDEVGGIPGVNDIYFFHGISIQTGPYKFTSVYAPNSDPAKRNWVWTTGSESETYNKFDKGWVFISETLAWKFKIPDNGRPSLVLPTDRGNIEFNIAGIFTDFSTQGGIVVMRHDVFEQFWDNTQTIGVAVSATPGTDMTELTDTIKTRLGDPGQLMVIPRSQIRETTLEVFDNTFAITIALRLLAALVAFIGILNTLMSLMMERTREIGVLRANGMTLGQLWRMILTECGLIGGIAGILAIPLGTILAWILVFVINKRSFGWSAGFEIDPVHYVLAVTLAVVASLLAGVYPCRHAGQGKIADALRME